MAGADNPVDQVVRLSDFREAHPEWNIWCDRERHVWHAERPVARGIDTVMRFDLRGLLDALGADG